MSGEVWSTPIVIGSDAVPTVYFENVRQNISALGRGGGRSAIAKSTEAANLTLPNETDNVFEVETADGNYVNYISTSGRELGNEITLITSGGGFTYNHDAGTAPAGFAKLYLISYGVGAGDITAINKTRYIFTLFNDGVSDVWLCTV